MDGQTAFQLYMLERYSYYPQDHLKNSGSATVYSASIPQAHNTIVNYIKLIVYIVEPQLGIAIWLLKIKVAVIQ